MNKTVGEKEPARPEHSERIQQSREALHYPAEAKAADSGQILSAQIRLSAAVLLFLLALSHLAPARTGALMQTYRTYMAGHDLPWREEILRFAGSVQDPQWTTKFTNSISVWADSARRYTNGIMSQVSGQAGLGGSGQKRQPDNYSAESYLPDRSLYFPLDSGTVSSGYGWREDPFNDGQDFHTGVDLAAPEGDKIYASLDGMVARAGYSASYGNYIVLNHGDGLSTLYAHMQFLFVRTGQRIGRGQTVGTVGQTGAATGPHLHFELFFRDTGYDPARALRL